MLPWIMVQPFAASHWALTLGLTATAFDAMKFEEPEMHGLALRLPMRLLNLPISALPSSPSGPSGLSFGEGPFPLRSLQLRSKCLSGKKLNPMNHL
jgi:tellurite resistance protein